MNKTTLKDHLFSIIVPVYNVEDYIEQCIQSIINQTEQSFELIIVDDGSTDASGEKCDVFARNNPKVKVIHKKNSGLISARRCGLKSCSGKYVIFVDSDDYLDIDALEKIKKVIEDDPVDIVLYRWKLIDEFGNRIMDNTDPLFIEGRVSKGDFVKELLSMTKLNSLCLKACKYELFDVDNSYEEYYSIGNGEDLLQTIPIVLKCRSIYYSHAKIYNYRANLNSLTHSFKRSKVLVLNTIAPKLYEAIDSLGMMGAENIDIFFTSYNNIIWNIFLQMFRAELDIAEQEKIYNDVIQYDYVKRAHAFFGDKKELFPIHIRMGLERVYTSFSKSRRFFIVVNAIRFCLLFVRTTARKAKSVMGK